jgi:cation:H+ antiporter
MVLGLVCLVLGSNWTVQGANTLIVSLGLDAMTMGLLLVAVASSLPELITSLLAAWRQEGEIAVGTVLGSNILNLLLVLGGAGLIHGQDMGVPGCALRFDLPVMAGLSLACLPVFFSGGAITRLQGLFFLLSYLGYAALVLGMSCGWLAVNPKQLAGMFLFAFLSGVLLASIRWLERRITSSLQALAFEAETSLRASWHQLRKLVVLIVGAATLLAGIALLVLPGPAFVVIPLGLALLGTEFVWARRLLSMMQKRVHKTFKRFSGPGSD